MAKKPIIPTIPLIKLAAPFKTTVGTESVDWGDERVRNVVHLPESIAMSMARIRSTEYKIVNPVGIKIESTTAEKVATVKELSVELASHFQKPAMFMNDIVLALRETKGDVFPLSGAISTDELEAELDTRGYGVIRRDKQMKLDYELTQLRAEVAELRSRADTFYANMKA
jgi:hypothetical protein